MLRTIVPAALIAVLTSCSDDSRTNDKVASAQQSLRNAADLIRKDPNVPKGGYAHAYLLPAYERTARAIEGKRASDFETPLLFLAFFGHEHKNGKEHIALGLGWLENGFETVGLYVENEHGRVIAKCRCINQHGLDKEWFGSDLWRDFSVPVLLDESDPADSKSANEARVYLSREALSEGVKVGLIMKDGDRTTPIEAYVPESLRPSDSNEAEGSPQSGGSAGKR